MYRNDKVIRRYSEPFKLKILAELTIGKHTKSELCKLYSIAPTTVNEWIKKYNRKDLMNTRVKVETKDKISRIKALQKEIEQLKKLLLNPVVVNRDQADLSDLADPLTPYFLLTYCKKA